MAHARYLRLAVYFVLGLILGANVVIAHAEDVPATFTWSAAANGCGASNAFSTYQAACTCSATKNSYSYSSSVVTQTSGGVPVQYTCKSTTNVVYDYASRNVVCPSGSTWNGSACHFPTSCPAPTIRQPDGSCASPCALNQNDKLGQQLFYSGGQSATVCDGSCSYNVEGAVQVCTSDGKCMGSYGSKTGSSCTARTIQSGNTPEYDCIKQGKSYGTVNGVTVCLAQGTAGSQNVTTTQPPSTSTSTDGSGSSSTTSNTTYTVNNNGTVTTTTTTTTIINGGTPQTSTEQKTQGKEDFCSDNPQTTICKNGTFSGGCGNFVCDGDGIQCAIAREQHERNCKLFDTATTLSNLGNLLGEGTDPDGKLDEFKQSSTVNIPTSLDTSNPYSASGLSDLTVSVGIGPPVTIPFSNLNYYLELMGQILVALALLVSGRIVGAY